MTDPWYRDYQAARQRHLALAEARAADDGPAEVQRAERRTCPWCGRFAPMDVERIGAASGPLHMKIRTCRNCGRATSRLEDR